MQKVPRKLLDQVSDAIRVKHYSLCTEKTYVSYHSPHCDIPLAQGFGSAAQRRADETSVDK
jgi:hypothetical protein